MYKKLMRITLCLALMYSLPTQADEWSFEYRLFTQFLFGIRNLEDDSIINADNLLELPEQNLELDFRPDFSLSNNRFLFSIKPRAELFRTKVELTEDNTETSSDSDFFLQEWLARAQITDNFSVSYGRENLQWGPALLLSSSNPFLEVNGRNSPQSEVGGMDYARLVWVASDAWATSFIVNTDDGRQDFVDHTTSYAIKLDYTGQEHYFSIIPSLREESDDSDDVVALGFFGGANINNALLAYVEGSLVKDGDSTQGLAGLSYTLNGGSNLILEYYYQQDGCTNDLIHTCLAPGAIPGNLERTRLLRKEYLFLNASKDWDQRRTTLSLRLIHNLNDDSNRLIAHFTRAMGDHWSGFVVGAVTSGDENTEFGSLVKSSLEAGFELTF